MDWHRFSALYAESQLHRDQLRASAELTGFFPSGRPVFPPVLGFGLPQDKQPVPVVTVALNASSSEFPDHVAMQDDAPVQWAGQASYFDNPYEEWWSTASALLRAATGERVTYAGPGLRAAHVDVTGVVTPAGMDSTYDQIKSQVREDVRSWLEHSLAGTFAGVLSNLVQENGTKALLVFGFAPAFPGNAKRSGSITLRDAFWDGNTRVNFVGNGGVVGKPTIAWGRMTGRDVPESLRKLSVFFVSRGPSSLFSGQRDEAKRAPLVAAAAALASRVTAALES